MPNPHHIRLHQLPRLHHHNLVRHPLHHKILAPILRRRHRNLHKPRLNNFCRERPSHRLKCHLVRPRRTNLTRKRRHTPRSIPTQLRLRPVRIEKPHLEICRVRLLHKNHPFATYPTSPRRHRRHAHIIIRRKRPITIINHDEVIPSAMHLDKLDQFHVLYYTIFRTKLPPQTTTKSTSPLA